MKCRGWLTACPPAPVRYSELEKHTAYIQCLRAAVQTFVSVKRFKIHTCMYIQAVSGVERKRGVYSIEECGIRHT